MNTEFLRPVPNYPRHIANPGSVDPKLFNHFWVNTEPLPPDLIDQIVINPQLPELFLNPSVLNKPNFLIDFARFTTLPDFDSSNHIISTPFEYGRALPLQYCHIPYGSGLVGMLISEKGCFVSGYYYHKIYTGFPPMAANSPWGFFGAKHAQMELDISNQLLSHGARTELVLGYLTLNPDKLSQFLSHRYAQTSPKIYHFFQAQLAKVTQSEDKPCLLFRLGGLPHRLGDDALVPLRTQDIHHLHLGLGVIAAEIFLNHPRITDCLPPHSSQLELLDLFSHLRRHFHKPSTPPLNLHQSNLLAEFLLRQEAHSTLAVIKTVTQQPQWSQVLLDYFARRNISLDLIRRDFELNQFFTPKPKLKQAIDDTFSLVTQYLSILTDHHFIVEPILNKPLHTLKTIIHS